MTNAELVMELRSRAADYRRLAQSWRVVKEELLAEVNNNRAEKLEMAVCVLSTPATEPEKVWRQPARANGR